ncbi:MAG: translation initiation factor IF-2 [Muribaculaceae bacterium]|nr:translation initiation factor IF-2 [Muribaculaceae bacterium]
MRTKISKIVKDLNVGLSTAVEFLRKHNIEVEENNPNARIDSDAVELLTKEFSTDKDVKKRSLDFINTKKEKKNDRAQTKEVKTELPQPKVLGKIDLATVGKPKQEARNEEKKEVKREEKPAQAPVSAPAPEKPAKEEKPAAAAAPVEKPARTEAPKADVKAEPKVQPMAPSQKPEQKTAQKPEAKHDEPKKSEPKPVQNVKQGVQVSQPKNESTTKDKSVNKNQHLEKNEAAKQAAPESQAPAQEPESKVFRLSTPQQGPELKVVGKIDLSSLNQATRPRKKSKAERARAAAGQGNESDRKKRKRIGKEKVDIEKAASQPGFGSDNRKKDRGGNNSGNNGGGGGNRGNGGGRNENRGGGNAGGRNRGRNRDDRRSNKPEVNAEDVQKQVKETLARLTNKTTKKSVKWRKEKREEMHNRELENQQREAAESRVIKITEFVTANDLANMMDVPINNVIATCMNLGVMVSINQRLDAETINIVAEEFGFTTEFVSADVTEAIETVEDNEEDLVERPPIVTVMGHVDHGKTSLLDYIRKSNVIAGEAGGITQHIGAYNVKLSDGRRITFLDTPGHEAFTAMRARGAKVTDLAIIIVAADDDVMPQTIEAINHASAAGVPMVFAINKIDKPAANPDKIKEELANMNYLVEEWGGKYQSQDISAKKGLGVDELMDKVLLEAELLELKANPDRNAIGSVIESSLDKGRGYVATVLVQNGTLHVGDVILAGTHYGKVKAMFNERNQRVTEAGPATPVLILGLNGAPTAGDTFNVLDTEQEAREIASKREQLQRELGLRTKKRVGLEELGRRRALNDFHELNLVVKGDVDGSIEALSDSLLKLSTPEVQVNVLHKGVGAISESDVTLAAASDAIIIGFQVRPSAAAKREAEKEGVEIRLYSVIYKAIEEVKDAMEGLLSPEIKEEITGTAEVLQTYHISKVGTIAGAIVRDGKIKRASKVRLIRDGIVIYTGDLGSLKRFKDDVKEVVSGYDCGLSIQGYNDIREGDLIEGFEEVEVKKTL